MTSSLRVQAFYFFFFSLPFSFLLRSGSGARSGLSELFKVTSGKRAGDRVTGKSHSLPALKAHCAPLTF